MSGDPADEQLRESVTHLTMPKSAICAADILAAWHGNDPERLNQRLAASTIIDAEPLADWCECERLELLNGIATQINHFIASGQDAGVYLPLLLHLAEPTSIPSNENRTC